MNISLWIDMQSYNLFLKETTVIFINFFLGLAML